MKKSGVRKPLSLMTRSPGILRSGVFLGHCGLKFERHLKVVLLAGTMGVLGSLAAYAGSSSVPLGANIEKTGPAGSVAAQTSTTCLPWDIACLLLRPVGTVPGGPPAGAGDRGQGGGLGGGGGGGGGSAPPSDDDGDSGPSSSDDGGDDGGRGNNGVGNGGEAGQDPSEGHDAAPGQAGIAEGDNSNPGQGRGFGRNGGGNAGGGNSSDHE